MQYKAVLFDLDDTLYTDFDTTNRAGIRAVGEYAARVWGVAQEAVEHAFVQARRTLARRFPCMPQSHNRIFIAYEMLEQFGVHGLHHAHAINRIYWQAQMQAMEVCPDAPDLLRTLHERGIAIAVCTDMYADIQLEKLDKLGLLTWVDHMVTNEEAGMDKPSAPMFLLALEKCGVCPREAVMVGDNFVHDIQGALDHGMQAVWINRKGEIAPSYENRLYHEVKDFSKAAQHLLSHLS